MEKDEKNIIEQRMRVYRAMQKPPMKQSDLLAKLHLNGLEITQSTLSTLSKIENAEKIVSDFELFAMSKALNVDILWLLGEKRHLVDRII